MEGIKSKSLTLLIFIPLALFIFMRPFLSGLAYPSLEFYYQNGLIILAALGILTIRGSRIKNNYTAPILLLLGAYALSTMTGINTKNSVQELTRLVSCVSIFFLVSQGDDDQKKSLVKIMVFSASLISLYSLYQFIWGYDHTLAYLKETQSNFLATSSYAKDILIAKRAIGTFPSPNIFGSYLIAMFFLSLAMIKDAGRRIQWFLPPILILSALLLTKSAGAWLSLFITLLILVVWLKPKKYKNAALLLIVVAFLAVFSFIIKDRWERFVDFNSPQNSITQRLDYWRTAIRVIKEHPFTGVGPGNFQEVFLKYKVGLSTDTRYAHNIFLHTWSETGILGLIGIFYLIAAFFKKLNAKPKAKFILLSGLALILHNLIDNSYFIPETGLFWWILLGLSLDNKL